MNIKAVIFDIDGTFYPNWRMHLMTLPVVLKNIRLFSAFAKTRKQLREQPELMTGNFYQVQAELTAKRLGKPVDEILKKLENNIYRDWTAALKKVKAYDNVRTVVQEIQSRGYKTACLSDFPILEKLTYFNLDDLFKESAYTCEDCGHLKPHSDAYEYVINKVGVKPEEILYVGNNHAYDVVGSKNAGMYAAHISNKEVLGTVKADFTFKKYDEFLEKFDNLIKGE